MPESLALEASHRPVGVLLLHGLTGTPTEMKLLAKQLTGRGCRVENPMLAGHGAGHKELIATGYKDWLASARTAFETLEQDCDQVYVVGLCMGTMLATMLAISLGKRVAGIVLLSCEFGILHPHDKFVQDTFSFARYLPFLRGWLYWTEREPYGLKDTRLVARIKQSMTGTTSAAHGQFRTYLGSLHQMHLLIESVEKIANRLECPVLVSHGLEDTLVPMENAVKLYQLIGSPQKSLVLMNGTDHMMTMDLRKKAVFRMTTDFILGETSEPLPEKRYEDRFSVKIVPNLDGITEADWQRLFPGLPDSLALVRLTLSTGFQGFMFNQIIIRRDNKPVMILPVFMTRYQALGMMQPAVRPWLAPLAKLLPQVFSPNILGVGLVEAEWSRIGVDASLSDEDSAIVDGMARTALDALAQTSRADIVLFNNVHTEDQMVADWPGCHTLPGLACNTLALPYTSEAAYLDSLSRGLKKNLKRKLQHAQDIRIVRTRDVSPWLDRLYRIYLDTVEAQDLAFGVHDRTFFARVCDTLPEAEFVLYFKDDKLLAFNLVLRTETQLVDKYFAMDRVEGRAYALYFISWMENVRDAIQHGLSQYHAGASAEVLKRRLGCTAIPTTIRFQHRNVLLHKLCGLLLPLVSLGDEEPLPESIEAAPAEKGRLLRGRTLASVGGKPLERAVE